MALQYSVLPSRALVRKIPYVFVARSATLVPVVHPVVACSRFSDSLTPWAAHRSPAIGRSCGGCPSGGWLGSRTVAVPSGGAPADFPALGDPAGGAELGGADGGADGTICNGGPAATPVAAGWLCPAPGLVSAALRINAPARVAVASTPTASAMPTKRSGPPGIRGRWVNVTSFSLDSSVPAAARTVSVRRSS